MLQGLGITLLAMHCIIVTGLMIKQEDKNGQRALTMVDPVVPFRLPGEDKPRFSPAQPEAQRPTYYNPLKRTRDHDGPDLAPADSKHFPSKYGGLPGWATVPPPEEFEATPAPEFMKENAELETEKEGAELEQEEASESKETSRQKQQQGESSLSKLQSGFSAFAQTLSNLMSGLFNGIATVIGALFEVFTIPFSPVLDTVKELSKSKEEREAERKAIEDAKEARRQAREEKKRAAAEAKRAEEEAKKSAELSAIEAERVAKEAAEAAKQKQAAEEEERQRKIEEENYKDPPLFRLPKGWQAEDAPGAGEPEKDLPPPGWTPPPIQKEVYPPYRDVARERDAQKRFEEANQVVDDVKKGGWKDLPMMGGGTLGDLVPTFDNGRLHAPKSWESKSG